MIDFGVNASGLSSTLECPGQMRFSAVLKVGTKHCEYHRQTAFRGGNVQHFAYAEIDAIACKVTE
jgi:hypothetical protein